MRGGNCEQVQEHINQVTEICDVCGAGTQDISICTTQRVKIFRDML